MGVRADNDLYLSLTDIVDELNKLADNGVSLTPPTIRQISTLLATVRRCHQTLAQNEALFDVSGGKVVSIHSVKAGRAS